MAKYQLLLPKMGESVAEATVIKWNKSPGDHVDADEAVMEIATDKVDSDVPSPVSGKLVEQFYQVDDVMQVGAVIAIIETEEKEGALEPEIAPAPPVEEAPLAPPATVTEQAPVAQAAEVPEAVVPEQESNTHIDIPGIAQLEQLSTSAPEQMFKSEGRFYSPLVRNIASQEGISVNELDRIPGTGSEGRLTKDDLLSYIQYKQSPAAQTVIQPGGFAAVKNTERPAEAAPGISANGSVEPKREASPINEPAAAPQKAAEPETEKAFIAQPSPVTSVSGGDEIIEMDRMRRLIADHMVMSKQTSPHVTSFVEADVTSLVLWREKVKNSFEKREGEKITFTPIFIEAVVKAIKDFPMINITVSGTQIIKKANINISMATALPSGNLIVPVIKKADQLNLLGITKAVNDLANRARIGKLLPDDVRDGTFTITNVGSFGNVMGTPIINQPQVAILAVGAIKKKPAVIETAEGDVIAIRHMMFLSLSYDHRVVDGALGGSFVRRVADYLEKWDLNREI
jgi:2-oxoglutarate dehydrogenase E2 component (dihydrolipoamide succinyltransferase)